MWSKRERKAGPPLVRRGHSRVTLKIQSMLHPIFTQSKLIHKVPLISGMKRLGRVHSQGSMPSATGCTHLQGPANFENPECDAFTVGILGDLHLPADGGQGMLEFEEAREQLGGIIRSLAEGGAERRIVQLGDLGSYERNWPGSEACFARASAFFSGFGLPVGLILGNHDLEGEEFDSDGENLAAWHKAFGQRHYWKCQLGPAMFIGLSTTKFRSNPFSVHEIYINDEQLNFFENCLEEAKAQDMPVVVFTHAPILGSGLKAVQAVHVKNRCAWVNHSRSNVKRFILLVQQHPQVKLWFSGHFHLSQNYPDSISIVGGTAFVLTGVIGNHSSRDGHRQSRILKGNEMGYELYTVDHDDGTARLDLTGQWHAKDTPRYLVPEDDLLCDPSSGWLCSQVECSLENRSDEVPQQRRFNAEVWFDAGPLTMLNRMDGMLIEYDIQTMAPIGAVFLDVPESSFIRLVDSEGTEVSAVGEEAAKAIAVEVVDTELGVVLHRAERNESGCFFQIFQPNKIVARKKKEAAQRIAAPQAPVAV